jgi:hypothetical protein
MELATYELHQKIKGKAHEEHKPLIREQLKNTRTIHLCMNASQSK